MRKVIVLAILFATTLAGYSQTVDYFEVGPYEVVYKGEGDFRFRLRKDIDLYQYFELKKDTVIIPSNEQSPVKQAIQANLFMSLPRFSEQGCSNFFGIDGSWKREIAKAIYVNAGLSFGISYGRYNASYKNLKETMLEIGIPLSVEFTKLDRKKASLYAGVGVTPMLYNTLKAEKFNPITLKDEKTDKENGFVIAPRIDFGGYVPVGGKIIRIGAYGEYKIGCSADNDIFKDRIGRVFVGANVGMVF